MPAVDTSASSPSSTSPPNRLLDLNKSIFRHQRLFLDSDIRERVPKAPLPYESIPVPSTIARELGDESQQATIVSQYFQSCHKWMPIISQTRLMRFARTSLAKQRVDYSLLLLCMKLIENIPSSSLDAARSPLYTSAKELLLTLEMTGVYSLLKLQASVLLTVYEMGHGLFPSAYVSMGHCVTHALALGIHSSIAPQILDSPRNWVDWEERQRVWWMIVILDRLGGY